MSSAQSSLYHAQSSAAAQYEACVGCAYAARPSTTIITTHLTTASADPLDDIAITLPLSIIPSDIMSSVFGANTPTTLVTDTDSVEAPSSTRWRSWPTSSGSATLVSKGALTFTRTCQSTGEETTVPIATETLTYFSQPLPSGSATGAITHTLGIASLSVSVSTHAGSSEKSSTTTKSKAVGGLNTILAGILGLWGLAFIVAWM